MPDGERRWRVRQAVLATAGPSRGGGRQTRSRRRTWSRMRLISLGSVMTLGGGFESFALVEAAGVGPSSRRDERANHGGSAEPSGARRWWTRRERCRTAGELRFDVPLLATEPAPLYQRIAKEASSLRYLGLSIATVAKHLRVDQKTAAKAIGWYGDRH